MDMTATARHAARARDRSPSGYLAAVVVSAAAVALRLALDPWLMGVQFITFYPAVMLVSYLRGARAGLLATLLCGVAAWYLFIPPFYDFRILELAHGVTLAFYFVTAAIFAIAIGAMRNAIQREREARAALDAEQEHQRLLINELNHRVKNTLAMVQGIAHQTFRGDAASPVAVAAFEGRLAALSAAQNILTEERWESASLRQIVEDAVAPYGEEAGRFSISGPAARLAPQTAVSLALALHELLTNAVKYGALSTSSGRIEIGWTVTGNELEMVWRELGGPKVAAPVRRGFGTRLIERTIGAELGGEVTIEFAPEGLVCTMRFLLARPEG